MGITSSVIRVGDRDATRREVVGGKAATLNLLAGAGFRVPAGFVLTVAVDASLGDGLDGALRAAADGLGASRFAVRSSAVAEDLPDASYAGLYETFLNVEPDGLGEAARRCFASAGDERIMVYQGARTPATGYNPSPASAGMAVLVQAMVDAEAAGVAFTANPVTGRRDEVVVVGVTGLGERLVSGQATGQEWVIHGRAATCARDGEGALSATEALQVADLARSVASRLGSPQDIEWALDSQRQLYLLQARAMTALPDPVTWAAPGPGLWTRNFRLGEWLPEAITPLFSDWLLPGLEDGYLAGMRSTAHVRVPFRYAVVNGWYFNATPIPSPRLLWRVLLDSRGRAPWFLYNALVRVSRDPAAADRAVLSHVARAWRDDLLPAYRALIDSASGEVDRASPHRLMEIVDEICSIAGQYLWSLALVGGSAWKMEQALGAFWRAHLADPLAGTPAGDGGPQALLRALPGAEPTYPPHAVLSLDWYHPTASETNGHASVLPFAPTVDLAWTRAAAEAACRVALRDRPTVLTRFDELLVVAQSYAVIREEQARDLTLGWPVLRRCAGRLAEHLTATGATASTDDFFFLTRGELTSALTGTAESLGGTAGRRREAWQRQRRLVAPLSLGRPPRLIGDPIARAVEATRGGLAAPAGAIIGHPASAGRATGRVRVVDGPADFPRFAAGEILVAKATTPAWTPLFIRAAAVVTDGGTLAAHASLVAREYGIPAVVGTTDATTRLRTGDLVTVDGSAGTVQHAESR